MNLIDVVDIGEIAQRAGVVKATVWSWQKRHSDFPAPQLEMGPVWDWAEVEAWLRARVTHPKDGLAFVIQLSADENRRAATEQEA